MHEASAADTPVSLPCSLTTYVTDYNNNVVRMITSLIDVPPAGVVPMTVNTLAGSGSAAFANGLGTSASFSNPAAVAVDFSGTGDIFVGDSGNFRLRRISASGSVSTLAGSSASGDVDGTGPAASFCALCGIAVHQDGSVLVADCVCNKLRRVDSGGVVTTLAGGGTGSEDGSGASAGFNALVDVAVAPSGTVFVLEKAGCRIRAVSYANVVTTFAGGACGYADATGNSAQFDSPSGLVVDSGGYLFVADTGVSPLT